MHRHTPKIATAVVALVMAGAACGANQVGTEGSSAEPRVARASVSPSPITADAAAAWANSAEARSAAEARLYEWRLDTTAEQAIQDYIEASQAESPDDAGCFRRPAGSC